MISIPRYDFNAVQRDPPHRKKISASCRLSDGTRVELATNWPETAWYLYASKNGRRASNSLRTSSKRIADSWERAVLAGEIEIR